MIDLNDRFVGLVLGLLMVLAFLLYLVIFGKTEKKSRGYSTEPFGSAQGKRSRSIDKV